MKLYLESCHLYKETIRVLNSSRGYFECVPADWVAIYFLKQNETQHKCNLCEVIVEGDSKSPNLLQHIVNMHKEIYELHKEHQDSSVGFQIEFVQFNMLKDDENRGDPIIFEEVCETEVIDAIKSIDKPNKGILDMEYLILPKTKKVKKAHAEFSRRRSWVWKYFDSLSNVIYRCKLCSVVLSIKGCNSNNMNRHVRTRHPGVFKAEVAKKELAEAETVEDKQEEVQQDVPVLTKDPLEAAKQRRSWVWSYFHRISSTTAQCKLCNRIISHGGNATGNMNRHLKMIHNKTAEMEKKKRHKQRSWIWSYFRRVSKRSSKCKLCNRIITHGASATGNINRHLKSVHKKTTGETEVLIDDWIIWLYYKPISKILAQCNICARNVSYKGSATSNLDGHLKEAHDITPDYKNWIWKVYENHDDENISCKICSHKCKKHVDIDEIVQCVLDHLKEAHDITSGSQIITGALFEVPAE